MMIVKGFHLSSQEDNSFMKFYYIDDSMFQRSEFSEQILFRFERYLARNKGRMVFISSSHKDTAALERFIIGAKNTLVLLSPALFEVEGIRGNLHDTFLAVEGFPPMESFSGSCVEYDTETNSCRRIYLELFPKHDVDFENIVSELEKILSEQFEVSKNTIIN